jgi:thymidylate synthase (FAD)
LKARIISYTEVDDDFVKQAQEEFLTLNPDKEDKLPQFDTLQDLVAFCARVSNPANQMNEETSERLIQYLIKNSHWSPLEMVDVTLEIETTRDIARQMLRHRSFSFQEFSQRYANPNELNNTFVLREARLQDLKNRQNSVEVNNPELQKEWAKRQQAVIDLAKETYEWAISEGVGIAKEQARCVLPEGNTISKLYMKGSLRSWIHYLQLRSANGTQKEHIEVALACAEIIAKVFPLLTKI